MIWIRKVVIVSKAAPLMDSFDWLLFLALVRHVLDPE